MQKALIIDMDIGDKHISKPRTITLRDVEEFCRANKLSEDFFLSDDAGKAASLKGIVVPGAQTLVILSGFSEEITSGLLLAAMDKIRFLAPLYPGDSVKAEIELLNKKTTSKGDRVFYTFSWALTNQDAVTIAQGETTECTTTPAKI